MSERPTLKEISGQAGPELRARLHQQLIRTEGGGIGCFDGTEAIGTSASLPPARRVAPKRVQVTAQPPTHQPRFSAPTRGTWSRDSLGGNSNNNATMFRDRRHGTAAATVSTPRRQAEIAAPAAAGLVRSPGWEALQAEKIEVRQPKAEGEYPSLPSERIFVQSMRQLNFRTEAVQPGSEGQPRPREMPHQQLEEQLRRLRMEHQSVRSENSDLQRHCAEMEQRHAHLEQRTCTELDELRQRNNDEFQRTQKIENELGELRRQRQTQALTQEREVLSQEVQRLRRKMDENSLRQNEEQSKLLLQREQLQKEVESLQSKLEAKDACECEAAQGRVAALAQQVTQQEAAIRVMTEELETTRAAQRDAEGALEQQRVEFAAHQHDQATAVAAESSEPAPSDSQQEQAAQQQLAAALRELEDERQARSAAETALQERTQLLERERAQREVAEAALQKAASSGSETRLRMVLTDRNATTEQLQQAIGAAEALVEEAKRELTQKRNRVKRAAYERLHAAIGTIDEGELQAALANAKSAGVEQDEISRAEEKLAQLLALSSEQRAAKAAQEQLLERKKQAFVLVKKDDNVGLENLLDSLDQDVKWQDWKDYMGRTLWRFAMDMRLKRAQAVLSVRLGFHAPALPAPETGADSGGDVAEDVPAEIPAPSPTATTAGDVGPSEQRLEEVRIEADWAELRTKAFGAVSRSTKDQKFLDDLAEILERLPLDVWSKWQNKAGEDLLTFATARGAGAAYSILAKASGLVQEMKREAFAEREDVWIFVQGSVQPKRATVLEDTPEEVDDILIEYWDGDDPPERVQRCLVCKRWS